LQEAALNNGTDGTRQSSSPQQTRFPPTMLRPVGDVSSRQTGRSTLTTITTRPSGQAAAQGSRSDPIDDLTSLLATRVGPFPHPPTSSPADAHSLGLQRPLAAERPSAAEWQATAEPQEGCEEDNMCVICLSVPKTHAFIPCGHRCVCLPCGNNVLKQAAPFCPICRADAQHLLQIFV
jgi:hypothetical protein